MACTWCADTNCVTEWNLCTTHVVKLLGNICYLRWMHCAFDRATNHTWYVPVTIREPRISDQLQMKLFIYTCYGHEKSKILGSLPAYTYSMFLGSRSNITVPNKAFLNGAVNVRLREGFRGRCENCNFFCTSCNSSLKSLEMKSLQHFRSSLTLREVYCHYALE